MLSSYEYSCCRLMLLGGGAERNVIKRWSERVRVSESWSERVDKEIECGIWEIWGVIRVKSE